MCKLIILQDGIFFSAYSCVHTNSAKCFGLLGFKVKGLQEKNQIFIAFLFLSQECPRGLYGYNCTQTCEVPYFGHRCVLGRCSCTRDSCNIPPLICSPKTGKKKRNKQEKTLTLIATYLAFFDLALKINTIREVFPRSAGNGQEIAIEVEQFE